MDRCQKIFGLLTLFICMGLPINALGSESDVWDKMKAGISIQNNGGKKFTTAQGKFYTGAGRSTYLTYDNHFSVDPYVCLLPKQTDATPLNTDALSGNRDTGELIGDTMDIWVNTGHVYDAVQSILDNASKSADYTIANFLNVLLKNIQSALGEINE